MRPAGYHNTYPTTQSDLPMYPVGGGENGGATSLSLISEEARQELSWRFWSHVNKRGPQDCWLWIGARLSQPLKNNPTNSQYGQFTYRRTAASPRRPISAHRFVWMLARGPIPNGLQVLHECDTPPCVNPAHLFLGTNLDNRRDAAAKNRLTVPRTRTLSLADRLAIYHTPDSHGIGNELARRYGVTKAAISIIRHGRFIGSGVWAGTKVQHDERKRA